MPIDLQPEIPDATVQADIDETLREIRVMKTRIDYLQEQIAEREDFIGRLAALLVARRMAMEPSHA
jgi:hypothetical protein